MSRTEFDKRALALVAELIDEPAPISAPALLKKCGGDEALAARVGAMLDSDAAAEALGESLEPRPVGPDTVPDVIGSYRLLGLLGQGGMGRVYRGERNDGSFERSVAIKFVQLASLQPELVQRFTAERQIMARLQHGNITQILDGGVHEGQPYLVMEYVDGLPFRHDPKVPRSQQLRRFAAVCDAVAHAHNNLILHRDLKPDNILVNAEGVPKLLDFGVAKLMETVSSTEALTVAGATPYTLQYAAPELVDGQPATVRTDIYALGVLLYELITDRRPYQLRALSLGQALATLKRGPEQPPTTGDSDLDLIITTAMHPDPGRRYASAAALQDDIWRLLDKRPLVARGDDRLYALRRFLRRHPLGTTASALALTLVVGLGVQNVQTTRVAVAERERAEASLELSQAVAEFLQDTLGSADPRVRGARGTTVAETLDLAHETLEREVDANPKVGALLYTVLANVHIGRGNFETATAYAARAEETLGSGPLSAEVRDTLASVYINLGRFDDAVLVVEAALDAPLNTPLNASQQARLLTRKGTALMLSRQQGEEELLASLALQQAEDTPAPQLLADTYSALAYLYLQRRELEQAAAHNAAGIEVLTRAGMGHLPSALQMKADHGVLMSDLGNKEEALALLSEAVETMTGQLGEHQPWVLTARTSLASIQLRDAPERAVELLEPLLEQFPLDVAPTIESAYIQAKLGYALCLANRSKEGLPVIQAALNARRQLYAADSWQLPDAEMVVGYCLLKLGQGKAARQALLNAERAFLSIYGPEHPPLQRIRLWLQEAADAAAS